MYIYIYIHPLGGGRPQPLCLILGASRPPTAPAGGPPPPNQPANINIKYRQKVNYFRLLNKASGPEIVDLWGLGGPLLPQIQWKRWVASPQAWSNGFCGTSGPTNPPKQTISDRGALLSNLKHVYNPAC